TVEGRNDNVQVLYQQSEPLQAGVELTGHRFISCSNVTAVLHPTARKHIVFISCLLHELAKQERLLNLYVPQVQYTILLMVTRLGCHGGRAPHEQLIEQSAVCDTASSASKSKSHDHKSGMKQCYPLSVSVSVCSPWGPSNTVWQHGGLKASYTQCVDLPSLVAPWRVKLATHINPCTARIDVTDTRDDLRLMGNLRLTALYCQMGCRDGDSVWETGGRGDRRRKESGEEERPTTPRYYSGSTKPPRVDKQQQQQKDLGEQSRWLTYLGHPQLLVTDSFSRQASDCDLARQALRNTHPTHKCRHADRLNNELSPATGYLLAATTTLNHDNMATAQYCTHTRLGATDGKRTQLAWFTSIQKKFCPLSRTQSPRGIKPRTESNTESSRNQAKNRVEHRDLEESSQEQS
ncbi:hypothetical protein RRG08_006217, partial [Elysia crispata]